MRRVGTLGRKQSMMFLWDRLKVTMDTVEEAWIPGRVSSPNRLWEGEGEGLAQIRTNWRVEQCIGVRGQ